MKSFNHKCIKVCLSMKVSLLYISLIYHSLSLTDDVYLFSISLTELSAVLQEVVLVTVSTIHFFNSLFYF